VIIRKIKRWLKNTKSRIIPSEHGLKEAIPEWEAFQWIKCPYCRGRFDILSENLKQRVYPLQLGSFCIKTEWLEEKFKCPGCHNIILVKETEYFYGESMVLRKQSEDRRSVEEVLDHIDAVQERIDGQANI